MAIYISGSQLFWAQVWAHRVTVPLTQIWLAPVIMIVGWVAGSILSGPATHTPDCNAWSGEDEPSQLPDTLTHCGNPILVETTALRNPVLYHVQLKAGF